MRTFIAIKLDESIQEALALLQQELMAAGADVKWVEPKNLHLTLKFIGEIEEERLSRVGAAIDECAQTMSSFSLGIEGLGAFPDIRRPRVIWAGVTTGYDEAKRLAGCLETRLQKIGIPKEERRFSSHITLGRLRSPARGQALTTALEQRISAFSGSALSMRVATITLFKSTLTPSGPRYEAVKEASLTTT